MTDRQRVTDEQLTEIHRRVSTGYNELSPVESLHLIADLRASRAREAELAAINAELVDAHNALLRQGAEARAERDGLQQRIDNALALADEWAAKVSVAPSLTVVEVVHSAAAALRAALTGTDSTNG